MNWRKDLLDMIETNPIGCLLIASAVSIGLALSLLEVAAHVLTVFGR